MKSLIYSPLSIATAAILAASLATPASAEAPAEPAVPRAGHSIQSVSIPYSAAELSTEQGRSELYGRIRQAAREVCGPTGLRETGSLAISSRNRACYREAVAAATSQVTASQVAALGK